MLYKINKNKQKQNIIGLNNNQLKEYLVLDNYGAYF